MFDCQILNHLFSVSHIIIKPNKYEHDLEHTDIGDNTNDTIDDPEAKEDSYTV